MIIRPATSADGDTVRDVLVEWWGGRDLTALLQPLFFENFASTSLIAVDGDSLAGFLVGFPSLDDPFGAYVHFVGVRPDLRGAGLGRRLHDHFAAAMAARGVTTTRCVTSQVNTDSIAFHQRIGFEIEYVLDEMVHFVRVRPAEAFTPRIDPRPADGPWPDVLWPVPESTVLEGTHVRLTLAVEDDAAELFTALDEDEVWAHVRGRPATPRELADSLAAARSSGRWPWIVRQNGRVVGTTSYLDVAPVDARLEIGFTLYSRSVWGTVVNPECKLLLMQWAFERGMFGRVQLKTDIRNARSQAAIARLGASYEGVLRRFQRRQDSSIRDTVLFSITAEQWPEVERGLKARLA